MSATWYGSLAFRVQLTAAGGGVRLRLTGVRQAGGSVPAGALLHGAAGAVPTTGYPVQPAAAVTLASAIGPGNSTITRSIGLRVAQTDAAGPWSTRLVYSLVVE